MVHSKCSWFNEPWEVEKVDPKHLVYVPPVRVTTCEDGDYEVLRDYMCVNNKKPLPPSSVTHVEGDWINDGLDIMAIIEFEMWDIIFERLNQIDEQF